jgi:putative DNA primase/helicase
MNDDETLDFRIDESTGKAAGKDRRKKMRARATKEQSNNKGRKRNNNSGEPDAEKREVDHRPTIQIVGGLLHDTATKAEAALIEAGVQFYARGEDIVRPIMEQVSSFHGRTTTVPRLKRVNLDAMRDYLSRSVLFLKWDKRAKKLVTVDPPHDIAAIILSRDGQWLFPPLNGLIATPTLRPDGSVLATPGYDPATGLLLLNPPRMPAIPERPTHDEALAALTLLDLLLDGFPFVKEVDRSVALSILMTPVLRGAMIVAPLHTATSPEARTGKSYLFDLATAIANGDRTPVLTAGRDEQETEKRIDAILLKGQTIIAIDNLNGDLGGARLCQAIERPLIRCRVLGLSKTEDIKNTVCVFGNGNNMRLTVTSRRAPYKSRLTLRWSAPNSVTFATIRSRPSWQIVVDTLQPSSPLHALTWLPAALSSCRSPRLSSGRGWSAVRWSGSAAPIRGGPMRKCAATIRRAASCKLSLQHGVTLST